MGDAEKNLIIIRRKRGVEPRDKKAQRFILRTTGNR